MKSISPVLAILTLLPSCSPDLPEGSWQLSNAGQLLVLDGRSLEFFDRGRSIFTARLESADGGFLTYEILEVGDSPLIFGRYAPGDSFVMQSVESDGTTLTFLHENLLHKGYQGRRPVEELVAWPLADEDSKEFRMAFPSAILGGFSLETRTVRRVQELNGEEEFSIVNLLDGRADTAMLWPGEIESSFLEVVVRDRTEPENLSQTGNPIVNRRSFGLDTSLARMLPLLGRDALFGEADLEFISIALPRELSSPISARGIMLQIGQSTEAWPLYHRPAELEIWFASRRDGGLGLWSAQYERMVRIHLLDIPEPQYFVLPEPVPFLSFVLISREHYPGALEPSILSEMDILIQQESS